MYIEAILKANPYNTKMFESNKDCYISKRNLERLGVFPIPCGARFKLLPFDMYDDFFTTEHERNGPDLFDVCREEYMNRHREKADADTEKQLK
jgi:hypothetical protein